MRQFAPQSILITVLLISGYVIATAQQPNPTPADKNSSAVAKLDIVPLVTLKPGETKELLLSTWCTVGITRGGGFGLTEMQLGKPAGIGVKSYSEGGVTITVPGFLEAEKFASAPEYSLLKEHDLNAFKVSITASPDAAAGLMEMHLVDATCGGHCKTDFRVLVVE